MMSENVAIIPQSQNSSFQDGNCVKDLNGLQQEAENCHGGDLEDKLSLKSTNFMTRGFERSSNVLEDVSSACV